jgi:putative membrane protein
MKIVKILFFCHLGALLFGLAGLLIALPHPQLWDTSPYGTQTFTFGMHYAGSFHILFGAATMLLFGLLCVGIRKTLIFFAASTLISLSMELLGTSTGFPFGPYAYTSFLGMKILGHVPYSIPLSWFSMGFTSFLLAHLLVRSAGWKHKTVWTLVLGSYFLTVWDLTLDPAMANTHLPVRFWLWYENGPYFGMPVRNLIGWSITGLIFMSVSRFFWHEPLDEQPIAAWLPFGVYTANTCFAIGLNLDAGLWLPPLIGLLLGLFPASLVLLPPPLCTPGASTKTKGRDVTRMMSHLSMCIGSQMLLKRNTLLTVEGAEHLPPTGPVVIAAHHVHHLYDGCALLSTVPRRLHILVAPDWIEHHWLRGLMEFGCGLLEWPMVLRTERLRQAALAQRSAYNLSEAPCYLRHAFTESVELLQRGEILVIFPEAYPIIDPLPTLERDHEGFLPFRPGFARIIEAAEKDKTMQVAIIPAGFSYRWQGHWRITLRFGPALFRQHFGELAQLLQSVEQCVRNLSVPTMLSPLMIQEVPSV